MLLLLHPFSLSPRCVLLSFCPSVLLLINMSGCLLSHVLLLLLFVCRAAAEDEMEVKSVFGDDCTLTCTAQSKSGVQYRAVRWYKVGEPPAPHLRGLVTQKLPNGTALFYVGLERRVELLGDSRELFLPNLTCSDGGVYTCQLAAPVGEQNREGRVRLTLTGCPEQRGEMVMADAALIVAGVLLMAMLIVFVFSYGSLRNLLTDRNEAPKKELFQDATLKPLEPQEVRLMLTLGPNWSNPTSLKHMCV